MAAAGKNGSNAGGGKGRLNAQQAMEAIGTLAAGHIAHAQEIHAQVKDLLGDAGSDPASAKALIYALMLCDDRSHYDAHLEWLGQQIEPELLERCRAYGERLKSAPEQLHLPLLELAMPALARLEKDRLLAFGERLKSLALRDEHLSFGELATVALMQRKIARKAQSTSAEPQTVGDADALAGAFSVLLTAVIRAGGVTDPTQAQTVLDSASAAAPLFSGLLSLQTSDAADSGKAQLEALETLGKAAPALKKQILAAATHAVSHDGHISPQEGEWLRLIAACMDCPMPPLVLG